MPASPQFDSFGELLRHLRKRAGLTQRDLGQAVGYSEAHIARLESGIRLPDVAVVKGAFVEALDLMHQPALAAQLVALAQAAHEKPATAGPATPAINPAAKGNLPAPATRLIGRENEVAALCALLLEGALRLVTLLGPGGVGKTRLALEVAHQVAGHFPDGAWWVELAPITAPQAALTSITQTLGIDDRSGKPTLRVLQDHLRDQHALLVLDNLEQVIEVAPMIAQLLSAAPKLRVLATSRELLRIAGEQAFTLNPLGDAAVELFVQRARAVQPDFALNEANAATIVDLCRRLDGLPLAIELAAARIPLFTPQEMLARLDHSLSLLTGGARDLPARQRTLRAALDWSYNLLAPDEQALFRRLGVFAGGYSLQAVQALCDSDGLPLNVLDGLDALVSKSLLIREEVVAPLSATDSLHEVQSRYRMLETVRAYARECMQARGEFDTWVRVMAEYLLSMHPLAGGSLEARENVMSALQWLNAAHDETGLALQLATSIATFTSHREEQILCLEQAIKSAHVPRDSEQLVFAKGMHGIAIGIRGDRTQAIEILNEVLAWYRAHDQRQDAIQGILSQLGLFHRDLGHADLARHCFSQALVLAQARDDKAGLRHLLVAMAENEIAAEDALAAETLLDKSMAAPALHDDSVQAWALNHRAHAAILRGEMQQAEALLGESSHLFSKAHLQEDWGIAWNEQSLSEIGLAAGNAAQGDVCSRKSLMLFDKVGDRMGMSWSLCGLAGARSLANDAKLGAQLWGAGEALREKISCRIAPASRRNRERTVALLKSQLGAAEFSQLAAEGATGSLEQAVEAALQNQAEK
jgi:predicted ATPase